MNTAGTTPRILWPIMPNPAPKTAHLTATQVRTPEAARELAARRKPTRAASRLVKVQVVVGQDQLDTLKARGVNRSELIRELLDDWLARNPE